MKWGKALGFTDLGCKGLGFFGFKISTRVGGFRAFKDTVCNDQLLLGALMPIIVMHVLGSISTRVGGFRACKDTVCNDQLLLRVLMPFIVMHILRSM